MSILAREYDLEAAKRVYAEELLEDNIIKTVKNLLALKLPNDHISQATGMSLERIYEVESGLQ